MKHFILNFVICVSLMSTCCAINLNAQSQKEELKNSPLVGIWIFERTMVDNNGNKITVYPGSIMQINPDGNFIFILFSPMNGGFINNEGKITLESDSIYTEKIEYNANPNFIGKELKFKYKIENDNLIKIPLNTDNSQNRNKLKLENEIWRRAKRPLSL
ncbi:MAG: DUF4488 domain-containing protein [Dysgonamonadaceae bacterium]